MSSAMQMIIDRDLPEYEQAEVTLEGSLPAWLCGSLVRTAVGAFRAPSYEAEHLFDALASLYAFDFRADGSVGYRQRLLDSELRRRLRNGQSDTPHFYSRMQRTALTRLLSPVPRGTDNTNVNVLPLGESLVAMTESNLQHAIDPATLQSRGLVHYEDELGRKLMMLAHPRYDHASRKLVNVATRFSYQPSLVVYEHAPAERTRRRIAEISLRSLPYQHSFGLTPKHALLFAGPLLVEPWRLLWSERGYIRHFRFRPELGSTIYRVDRGDGSVHEHHAPALFVFHVINAFERSDETVLDVLAYDDASVIDSLTVPALRESWPRLNAKPLRLRLRSGRDAADVSPLGDARFEFPTLDHARAEGRPYRFVWGSSGELGANGYQTAIVRLDLEQGSATRFEQPGYLFGEPLFVPDPDARAEGQGVLLSVAVDMRDARGALFVLDAETLALRAFGALESVVPFSFHGSFLTRAPHCLNRGSPDLEA